VRSLATFVVMACAALPVAAQHGQFPTIVDEGATVDPKLGEFAALDLTFVDERNRPSRLADRLTGERPVLLNLGYFSCPGMCGFVLNTFLDKLKDSGLEPGQDFDLWTISIDHTEGARLASDKKRTYVEALTRQAAADQRVEHADAPAWTANWPFFTGDEQALFHYRGAGVYLALVRQSDSDYLEAAGLWMDPSMKAMSYSSECSFMASLNETTSTTSKRSRTFSSRLTTWSWHPSQLAKSKKATLGLIRTPPVRF